MKNHLTPNSMLWRTLNFFRSDPDVQAWKAALFTPAKPEIFENFITMAPTVHASLDCSEFVSKPIRTDPYKMFVEVEFYWLKHLAPERLISLVASPDLQSDHPSGRGDLKFWDCLTEKKIISGDTIILRTDDSVKRPLPGEELLRMQWYLTRVAALPGTSEVLDSHQQDDENDGDRGVPYCRLGF